MHSISFRSLQARFQAQQLAEKEEKMIHLLERRQDEAVRRVAYAGAGRTDSAASHSANSMSSTNSSSNSAAAGVGARPTGRVRKLFEERRKETATAGNSPVGWDKSYPLKPVTAAGLYRRHNSTAGGNKYSGNYGPKRSLSQNRGVSLDRGRYVAADSGYSSSVMSRARSHHQLSNSSGEESNYGARPVSTGYSHHTYNGRGGGGGGDNGYYGRRDASPVKQQTSYTREYVRNLPPATAPPRGRLPPPSSSSSRGRRTRRDIASPPPPPPLHRSGYEHSSFSSQSSERSSNEPPPFGVLSTSRSQGQIYTKAAAQRMPSSATEDNLSSFASSATPQQQRMLNGRTYRCARGQFEILGNAS